MSDVKMSDVFNMLTYTNGREIGTGELVDSRGNWRATFGSKQAAMHAATAINSYDSNQELIADLQRKVAWFEQFACKTCGGAGSVGMPPDDYYDCPECVQPHSKKERETKELIAKLQAEIELLRGLFKPLTYELQACQNVLHSLAHQGEVCWDYSVDAKKVLEATELALAATAKEAK